ncbi:hypothetical protein BCD_1106 (plasmid) [Borrelia crocidurae DOU]|uniref:Lipoprotein n=2 Tax=Borrelia crocidurae DOU TaxID=1293575 RepID=W5SJQ6_9SPIR|nr:hypothetical protein [Borrelia crocidurae]AHH07172.1 hypothetical protein BCD_1106 [Borrelia crocidurae DOU]
MKFKNKFLILSLLFSFISCDLFLDKDKGALEGVFDKYIEKYSSSILDSNNDTIEENSKSSQHVDLKTSKKRSKRSVVEETAAEVVEPVAVLKAVVDSVVKSVVSVVESVVEEDDGVKKEVEKVKEVEEVKVEKKKGTLEAEIDYVKDALSWIKTIKETNHQTDIMSDILAIYGDIVNLKKIISQKYEQRD